MATTIFTAVGRGDYILGEGTCDFEKELAALIHSGQNVFLNESRNARSKLLANSHSKIP
jgi:hypothetical protein